MTEEMIISIGAEATKTIIFLAGPLLAAAMIVGLLVSIFQAVTQINESTLTFIPKMIAVIVVLSIMSPWMLEVIKNYTTDIFENAGSVIR
jgi:flagellar biosynthetic protein FliQ